MTSMVARCERFWLSTEAFGVTARDVGLRFCCARASVALNKLVKIRKAKRLAKLTMFFMPIN